MLPIAAFGIARLRSADDPPRRHNLGLGFLGDAKLGNNETNSMPEVVYHYTSMNALLGIVDGDIWATNIQYLNDISEYTHFLELVKGRLPHLARSPRFRHPDLVTRLVGRRRPRASKSSVLMIPLSTYSFPRFLAMG